MIITDETFAGGDERDKLIPELERSADEQLMWLALGVVAVLALLLFGASRLGGGAAGGLSAALGSGDSSSLQTIDDLLDDESDLDYTNQLFELADINDDLARGSRGPYTVFAPTDAAWEDLADATGLDVEDDLIDELNSEEAGEGAGFHIVEGEYTLDELLDEGSVITVDGYELTFDDDDLINGTVEIEDADIEASNGMVHKIDTVLPTD